MDNLASRIVDRILKTIMDYSSGLNTLPEHVYDAMREECERKVTKLLEIHKIVCVKDR